MTTTTAAPLPKHPRAPLRNGYTIVELIIAVAVSGILLTAVISVFIFLGRSSTNLTHYTDMEQHSRRTLQQFGLDTREAEDASWTDANTLVLTVGGNTITYQYDSDNASLLRTAAGKTTTLATHIQTFAFRAFQLNGTELSVTDSPTTIGPATKMIQLEFDMARSTVATPTATETLVSARFVLRNKSTG